MWGATRHHTVDVSRETISIHAPRVGGDLTYWCDDGQGGGISIHAPRVGGDFENSPQKGKNRISIHAPRVGGDMEGRKTVTRRVVFQSTPPVWGATQTISPKILDLR